MEVIQIDMPVPENCGDCRFCELEYTSDDKPDSYAYCSAAERFIVRSCDGTDKVVSTAICNKAGFCPLKPIVARVMTLEEALALKFDDVVYYEVFPTNVVLSAIVIDVIPKLPDIGIGVIQFRYAPTWNGINNADLSYYGKTWRCWTSRPDQETREATPWERLN